MAETSLALDALIGVIALALIEGTAWALGRRRSHPPGVADRVRLSTLATSLGLVAGLTAIVAWAVSLPTGRAAVLGALAAGALTLLVAALLSLGSAASRS